MLLPTIHPGPTNLNGWRAFAAWLIVALAPVAMVQAEKAPTAASSRVETEEFFEKSVRPILADRCLSCHGGPAKASDTNVKAKAKIRGGLDLSSRAKILEGGDSGPAIVPGNVEDSLLVRAIRYHDEPRMPPDRRLGDAEISNLSRWIEQGAPWPAGNDQPANPDSAATSKRLADSATWQNSAVGRSHWSFQPVSDPAVPETKDSTWPNTAIDHFVLAKLESKGLNPSRRASRRTLIRRASFDLIGLPPTPEEVDAFEQDPSPEPTAFERVVDRLLGSPRYGERWGRHWLDLVRYADTAGETGDYPVPEARHYRDYVIDSFNADIPYNQFLVEQIAGDLIAANNAPERHRAAIVATGFLAIARRFGFDPQNYHHLTIDDTIDTLGKSVLGMTIACARCHDHKFDPIPSTDYYALYGIFESTRYAFPGSEETKRPKDFVAIPIAAPNPGESARVAELIYGVVDSDKPADTHLQRRGDPKNLGSEVRRGVPAILGGGHDLPPIQAGSGRRELADWLTDPAHPLTYRVLVNRIWQYHFGRGLVASASNFGIKGSPPSHPELLDWLASRFVDDGFSVKSMHRRIMLSAAYQQDSAAEDNLADPANIWLSHFNRQRLDAEGIRDAILFVSECLNQSRGGPHPFPPVDQWKFTQHNPFLAVYPSNHRSVYLMTQRLRRHPFLALFDGADPNASTEGRGATTVPTQSLFFLNDPLVHRAAEDLAGRLIASTPDPTKRIDLGFRIALGRQPSTAEIDLAREHLRQARDEMTGDADPPETLDRRVWASFARILFGTNEFIYID